jgi:hypothetical protein
MTPEGEMLDILLLSLTHPSTFTFLGKGWYVSKGSLKSLKTWWGSSFKTGQQQT